MDIYIKPVKKASIARKEVLVQDIAEVVATADVAEKVKKMRLLDINTSQKKANYLISVTDIVKIIKKSYPEYTVNNLGEMDTVIDYKSEKSKDNKYVKWLKIAFVTLVLLTGSSTAIMSFHSDAQMPKVFQGYYKIFYGKETEKPWIISIPYAVGLAAGIIVFFNHFAGKKITDDPTPIEVEMSLYENEVNDTVLDVLNTERIRKKEGKPDDD